MVRKAKRGPALFELLAEEDAKGPDNLKTPAGWSESGRQGPRGAIKPESRVPVTESERNRSEYGSKNGRIPFIQLDEGRIQIALTSLTGAAAVFVALVIVVGAFEWGGHLGFKDGVRVGHEAGRASYAAETMSEIETARLKPPATYLVSNLLDAPPEGPDLTENTGAAETVGRRDPQWIRDYTYIVAQEFSVGRLDDVEPARQFLAEHGISTAAVPLANGRVQLITTQGYNHKDPAQRRIAERLLEKVHRIGAEYYASSGGYRLKGYFKTLKGDDW